MHNPYSNPDAEKLSLIRDFGALPRQNWPDQWHSSDEYLQNPPLDTDEAFRRVLSDGLSFHEPRMAYRLGNPDLPVAPYREHITDTILNNTYTVLSSPTGTGKSSQTGLYLLESQTPDCTGRIFISSPRILAARQLMDWARKGLGEEYAPLAGYLTGTEEDSDAGDQAKVIYVTEQKLFKMANRGMLRPQDIVVNDEAHERSIPTVFLQGIMKELIADNPDMKLIISSATMDTRRFSEGFVDPRSGKPAAIISLNGTTYPITDIHTDRPVHEVAKEYMQQGNVLVFEPGEQRQVATQTGMQDRVNGHVVHILNATMPPSEQAAALNPQDKHHVVGNKTAETSLTPDGKDFVIDSGLSNIGKYEAGVRVLKTVHSSKDVMMQRRGRIGRTKPGTYIVAWPSNAPPIAYEDRDDYEIPPIENGSVADYITELLAQGRHIENMDLRERPTAENLTYDYKLMRRLGAIVLKNGEYVVTETGRAMNDLPLEPPLARMLVEARSIDSLYNVDVARVRTQVAAATAIRQVRGILNAWNYSRHRYRVGRKHEEDMSTEHKSDMLFELDVFIKAYEKQQKIIALGDDVSEDAFVRYLRSKDIFPNRYHSALKIFKELCFREGMEMDGLDRPDDNERLAIIGCQVSGTEELFVQKSKYMHYDIRGESRRLGKRSTIDPSLARLVVGTAFDLVGMHVEGHFKRGFIVGGSAVSTRQLLAHAPGRITRQNRGHSITPDGDIVQQQALYFDNEVQFDVVDVVPEPTIETRAFILRAMMTGVARSVRKGGIKKAEYAIDTPNARSAVRQWDRAQDLEHRTIANLRTNDRYNKLIEKVIKESVDIIPLDVTDPHELDAVIPRVYLHSLVRPSRRRDVPEILRRSPDAVTVVNSEDEHVYLPVYYRNSIAYVTVPISERYNIRPEDIAVLTENYNVKIRVGKNGQYMNADAAFAAIEERRNSPQRKQRLERRAENDAKKSSPESHEAAIRRLVIKKKGVKKVLNQNINNPVKKKRTYAKKKTRGRARDKSQAIAASIEIAS